MRSLLRIALLALAFTAHGSGALAQRSPGWIGIGFEVRSGDVVPGGAARVVVTEVRVGSPAAAAGIRVGDRLLAINDVRSGNGFDSVAERLALRAGDRVEIRLEREGRRIDLSLRAAERPTDLLAEWTTKPAFPADSMVETMFRAMDSLRAQLQASTRRPPAPSAPEAPTARFTVVSPTGLEPFDVPFEFFVFRGEQHDSLRREMESLNRQIEVLRRREENRVRQLRRANAASRADLESIDTQLAEVRTAMAEVTRQSAALRAAMAEAARVAAGLEYAPPALPEPTAAPAPPRAEPFRPLTPYLLGSNRVAGAQVIDLRPGLAEYFRVEGGVLIVDVAPGTPAAIAGMQPGDVIVNLDRVLVRSVDALRAGVSQAGDTLPVTLIRQGSSLEVLLRRR